LSFSVDINTAKEIARQLIATGKVFKAYVGLMLQEIQLNAKVRSHHNLENRKGLFISRIEPDSPASRSQLEEGDIIVAFNGKTLNSTHDFFRALAHQEILTMVDISVIRHTALLNFSITPVLGK
jgi:S1-C subfamily serine protease